MIENQDVYESRHFTVELLADGVFAVFHREGGWAVSIHNCTRLTCGTFFTSTPTVESKFLLPSGILAARLPVQNLIGDC